MRNMRERKEDTEALMAKPFRTLVACLTLCRVRVDGSSMDIKVPAAEGGMDSLVPVASPSSGVAMAALSTDVRLRIPSRIKGSPILCRPRPALYPPAGWSGDCMTVLRCTGGLARVVEDSGR